nr:hypothetical protein B0A51_05151 [Rachicladosporium sp. CCFEE 5018]OQO28598.1 hypothetical protein B0A51_05417 [Rachicladosporium sp. CCFEE 5018]
MSPLTVSMAPPPPQQLIAPCYLFQILPEMIHNEAKPVYLDCSTFRFRCSDGVENPMLSRFLGRPHTIQTPQQMRRVVVNVSVSRSSEDSRMAALTVLDLLRASRWLAGTNMVTTRFDHKFILTQAVHDMLTAFAMIQAPGQITLVLQRGHVTCQRVAVHELSGGYNELNRLIEDIETHPSQHGFRSGDSGDFWPDDEAIDWSNIAYNQSKPTIPDDCHNNSDCRCLSCRQYSESEDYTIHLKLSTSGATGVEAPRTGRSSWSRASEDANRIGVKALGRLQLMINDEGELKIKGAKE